MNKKSVAILLAVLLVVGIAIGGTMAWLTSTPGDVINTFTTGDVNITLDETEAELVPGGDGDKAKDFQMIPGWTIDKDPKVTVLDGSEACYVFVQAVKSENFDSYMTYQIADGWTELPGYTGVYYQEFAEKITEDTELQVLKEDRVTVLDTVTKEMMNSLDNRNDYPTLTFKAYAIQLYKNNTEKFDVTEAWKNVSTQSNA